MRHLRPTCIGISLGKAIGSSFGIVAPVVLLAAFAVPTPVRAADGCTALLCLSCGNWNAITQCVPTVREVLRDLARGRPFPSCDSAGTGNRADHEWAAAPTFCPPQYTRVTYGESAPIYTCDYVGAVTVRIGGQPFARTWWRYDGDSVTEFSAMAKATLGLWDRRFDDDYAQWVALQPPSVPEPPNP